MYAHNNKERDRLRERDSDSVRERERASGCACVLTRLFSVSVEGMSDGDGSSRKHLVSWSQWWSLGYLLGLCLG